MKRKITIGSYDTAAHGWTLVEWAFSEALQKTNYLYIPGADGSLDASTALSDGIPRYSEREFTATLEISTGDRLQREAVIREMINTLDGFRWSIELPDDEYHPHGASKAHKGTVKSFVSDAG